MINPSDIREILFDISKKIILPSFGNLSKDQISYKNEIDIVTEIDIDVELQLNIQLSKLIKTSYFIGEETYSKNPSILDYYSSPNFCWTVDPIDGTKNFAKSKNKFAIMIALTKKNKIIQTFIYKPISEDFIYADKDGSYIDDKKIILKDETKIKNAIGSISIKYWDNLKKNCEKRHDPFEKYINEILLSELDISPIKSLSIHLTNVNSSYGLSPFIDIKKLWEDNKIN